MINCKITLVSNYEPTSTNPSTSFVLTDNFVKNELNNDTSYVKIEHVFGDALINVYGAEKHSNADMPVYLTLNKLSATLILSEIVDNMSDLHDILHVFTEQACICKIELAA